MNVIASVLAGQGVAHLVEAFGIVNPLVSVCVAVLSTFFISIGLFIWKERF